MGCLAAHLDSHLYTASMPYAYMQVSRLAYHHIVGANALLFYQRPHGQPLTGLLLDHTEQV